MVGISNNNELLTRVELELKLLKELPELLLRNTIQGIYIFIIHDTNIL